MGTKVGKASDHSRNAKVEQELKSEADEEEENDNDDDEVMSTTTDGDLALHPDFTPSPSKLSSGKQSPQGKRLKKGVQSPAILPRKGEDWQDHWDGWKDARDTWAAPASWSQDNSDGYGVGQSADHYAPYSYASDRSWSKGKGKRDKGGKDKGRELPESEDQPGDSGKMVGLMMEMKSMMHKSLSGVKTMTDAVSKNYETLDKKLDGFKNGLEQAIGKELTKDGGKLLADALDGSAKMEAIFESQAVYRKAIIKSQTRGVLGKVRLMGIPSYALQRV